VEVIMKKRLLIITAMLAAVPFLPAQQPPVPANTAILAPPRLFITIVTPNGGEEVLRGAQQTVQWTKVGDVGRPTVQVKKGGVVVAEFARVTPEGPIAGKYRWTWNVPAAPPTRATAISGWWPARSRSTCPAPATISAAARP
jgi:hypothetical protein